MQVRQIPLEGLFILYDISDQLAHVGLDDPCGVVFRPDAFVLEETLGDVGGDVNRVVAKIGGFPLSGHHPELVWLSGCAFGAM